MTELAFEHTISRPRNRVFAGILAAVGVIVGGGALFVS